MSLDFKRCYFVKLFIFFYILWAIIPRCVTKVTEEENDVNDKQLSSDLDHDERIVFKNFSLKNKGNFIKISNLFYLNNPLVFLYY